MTARRVRPRSAGYQLFMLVLCVYALVVLAAKVAFPLDSATVQVLEYADTFVCLIFLADFVYSLWTAEKRWKYLLEWGWLDFLSSIPAIDVARWGRAARILRIFRVLRGLRATQFWLHSFSRSAPRTRSWRRPLARCCW